MLKDEILQAANDLNDELVQIRRTLHQNPETSFDLPKTLKLVKEKYYNEFIKYYGKEHVTEEDAEIVRDLIMRSGALDYAEDTIVELLNLSKEEIIKLKNKHVKDTLLGLMEYLRLREK